MWIYCLNTPGIASPSGEGRFSFLGESVVWGSLIFIALYLVVANAPLILIAVLRVPGDYSILFEIGRGAGLTAFGLILLQPVLAARLKRLEQPFGLDIVSRFHKFMGVFAAALLLFHPTLMAQEGLGWSLLTKLDIEWYYWVGRVTLLVLFAHTLISIFRQAFGIQFELWRRMHYTLAAVIVAAVFVHSWWGGYDMGHLPLQILWVVLVTMAFAAYTYHKILMPMVLRGRPYTVSEVRQETHNVWDVKFVPPSGVKIYEYIPGQFHFVTLYRGGDLPVEEHHWTISSSPTQQGFISSTIKESGDFTKTIGLTKPGDRASVQGPFGRFSLRPSSWSQGLRVHRRRHRNHAVYGHVATHARHGGGRECGVVLCEPHRERHRISRGTERPWKQVSNLASRSSTS